MGVDKDCLGKFFCGINLITVDNHQPPSPQTPDGYIIPKGANVTLAPILMHRDPNIYPDPEIFNPERFSPENILGKHPYRFISFSAGARNCIGQKFAMLEMKSTVSKVLRNYRLLPGSTTNKMEELVGELVLKNINGMKLKLIPRKLQKS
uniref:Cytochrome P450 n=1 Tax=Timema shepardi TaxID=629360 RepID=A0A7R9B9Z2_TIMSH|nr:unnamed protein product [Timema shepardi]